METIQNQMEFEASEMEVVEEPKMVRHETANMVYIEMPDVGPIGGTKEYNLMKKITRLFAGETYEVSVLATEFGMGENDVVVFVESTGSYCKVSGKNSAGVEVDFVEAVEKVYIGKPLFFGFNAEENALGNFMVVSPR